MGWIPIVVAGAATNLASTVLLLGVRTMPPERRRGRAAIATTFLAAHIIGVLALSLFPLLQPPAVPPDASRKAARVGQVIAAAFNLALGGILGIVPVVVAVVLRAKRTSGRETA